MRSGKVEEASASDLRSETAAADGRGYLIRIDECQRRQH